MKPSQLLLAIVLAVGISIPSTLLINRYLAPPTQIVTVNLKQLVQDYAQSLQHAQGGSHEDISLKTHQFEVLLRRELLRYISDNNAVVLVEPAVIEGAIDITPTIKQQLAPLLLRSSLSQPQG
ncbi:TrbI F-type domain-containing protein [Photobacterium phosphoreum]|uniref:TrbI F-type domain-containing protein n=1 Tax=Photobacterium phosphoreum TaxID=659 RepID=UPI001E4455B7|nr:TrbI F-type domain-containing protein [Photobacterium phosphoreum]MCD9477150.1 hypothetical protein [Photobacterium phosphoreum]MCF2177973.1 hypothetical protein [Photobacterium phosphoreum]